MKILDDTGLAYFWSKIKAWCSALFALDANVVHLSGNESVGGTKTFTDTIRFTVGQVARLLGTNNSFSLSTSVSSDVTTNAFAAYDIDGNSSFGIQDILRSNDTHTVRFYVYRKRPDASTSGGWNSMGINTSAGGTNDYGFAPNTPSGITDNTAIITKGYSDSKFVHRTGNETVAGVKNFTSGNAYSLNAGGVANTIYANGLSVNDVQSACVFMDADTSLAYRYYGYLRCYPKGATNNSTKSFVQLVSLTPNAANTGTVSSTIVLGIDNDYIPFMTGPATSTSRNNVYDVVTRGFLAEDTRLVHTTGDETINGNKTFTGTIQLTHNSLGAALRIKHTGIERGGTWMTQRSHFVSRDKNDNDIGDYSIVTTKNSSSLAVSLTMVLYNPANATDSGRSVQFTANDWNDFIFGVDLNSDNIVNLGTSLRRWKQVFAGTATINTSDERCKDSIADIPDAVLDAWLNVRWRQFRFTDAVEEKGNAARLHSGTVAQDIQRIFSAAGLDASRYGLFCYDRWDAGPEQTDESGRVVSEAHPAGDRYSLRYEEALCMEAACMRRENARLKKRIADLEDRLAALELKVS